MIRISIAAFVVTMTLGGAAPSTAQQQRLFDQPLAQMDTDNSGTISRDEWRFRPERFDRLDANQDGVLTPNEVRWQPRTPRDRRRAFGPARSRTYEGRRAMRIDRLHRRAAKGARRTAPGGGWGFRSLDVDRNGVISRQEWRRPGEVFDRLDRDRDGVLSGFELARARRRVRALR